MGKSKKQTTQIDIISASGFHLKKTGKYLLIMPVDADLKTIAPAISKFFAPVPVFILAANQVSEIKIAELLEGENA